VAEQFDFRKYIKNSEATEAALSPVGTNEDVSKLMEKETPKDGAQPTDETQVEEKIIPTLKLLFEEEYICGFCKGKGERPPGSICPVCRKNKTLQFPPPVVKCAHCRGRGDEKPRSQVTCSACRGKGYIPVTEPVERCPGCRGSGSSGGSKLPCMRCKGAGVVTVKMEGH